MFSTHRIVRLLERILWLLENLFHKLFPHTNSIYIKFGGTMPLTGSVIVGATDLATVVPLEADGVTQTPGAVVSAPQWSIDNPTLATIVSNPDGSATVTGVAPGTANVSITCTVTDSDGTVGTFSASAAIVVNPAPARTAKVEIQFAT